MRSSRLETVLFAVVGLMAGVAALLVVNRIEQGSQAAPPRPRAALPDRRRRDFVIPRGESVVAHALDAHVVVRTRPNGRVRTVLKNPIFTGGPLVFLVKWDARVWSWPAWVRVYLPMRPNGTTGWIRASRLRFLLDPYSLAVRLRAHRIALLRRNRTIAVIPVGVGRSVTPTPTGRYFLELLVRPRERNGIYGPYAFGTSAFSNVLYSFGGGPGEVGIHGTDYPAGIGTDVSHGCIRMSNANITRLAHLLPLGTPVAIER